MTKNSLKAIGPVFILTGLTFSFPAPATPDAEQVDTTGALNSGGENSRPDMLRSTTSGNIITGMTHDMSSEMLEMAGMLERGTISSGNMLRMSGQMKKMSGLMERMSGLVGKGVATEPEIQKQMEDLRREMDQFRKAAPVSRATP